MSNKPVIDPNRTPAHCNQSDRGADDHPINDGSIIWATNPAISTSAIGLRVKRMKRSSERRLSFSPVAWAL